GRGDAPGDGGRVLRDGRGGKRGGARSGHAAKAGLGQERATIHMVSSTVTGAHACRTARGGGSLAVPTVDANGFCRPGGTRPQPRPGAVTSDGPGQASPSAFIAACT